MPNEYLKAISRKYAREIEDISNDRRVYFCCKTNFCIDNASHENAVVHTDRKVLYHTVSCRETNVKSVALCKLIDNGMLIKDHMSVLVCRVDSQIEDKTMYMCREQRPVNS